MFRGIKQKIRQRKLARHGLLKQCDLPVVRYGDRSGVWAIYADALKGNDVVYSFGVGNNIAWDLAMIKHHNVQLYAFDPTPRSINWVAEQSLPDAFAFYPLGLSDSDGQIEFLVPRKEHKVNYSAFKQSSPEANHIKCEVRRLTTLMAELGHQSLAILKMDIEGGEIDALNDILQQDVFIGQLLVEFHYHYPTIGFDRFRNIMSFLNERGYLVFDVSSRGYEFSLVHQSLIK